MIDPDHKARSDESAADLAAWNKVADRYVSTVGGAGDRIYSMLQPALWASLGDDLRGLEILDLGCGHGWLSALMANAGARVRGVDGSDALLEHARRTVPDVQFLRCDLTAGQFPTDRHYDRIVAHMVLTMPHPFFFNYKTRSDPETGELYCGVTD